VVDAQIQSAIHNLQSEGRSERLDALRRLLGKQHPDIARAVIPLLRDPDPDIRVLAAQVLGSAGDESAVPALIAALLDPSTALRAAASNALLTIGTPQALAAIGITEDDRVLRRSPFETINTQEDEEAQPDDTPRGISGEIPKTGADDDRAVQFSAYYPKEVAVNMWSPMRAYVFRAFAADQVARDAEAALGVEGIRETRRESETAVAEGALITATPEIDGFQFNPRSASIQFFEDWQRFEFKLRAVSAPLDQAANGRITFTVEGVIAADIPLSIYVGGSASSAGGGTSSTTSVRSAGKPYDAIFCSYSHRDTQIVERVERAYRALGLDYLRDVITLKSGQEWNAELLRLIERADIFQLFWSKAAAESKYVREEWEHALALKRPAFIRPVYWEQPMPPVPPELGHIHFAYQPNLDD
jgi:hypothetical protein